MICCMQQKDMTDHLDDTHQIVDYSVSTAYSKINDRNPMHHKQ